MKKRLSLLVVVLGCLLAVTLLAASPGDASASRGTGADSFTMMPDLIHDFLPAALKPTDADWWADCDQEGAYMGWGVSQAGDTNGDGYDDVIVGATFYPSGGIYRSGRAWLFFGSAGGLEPTPRVFDPPVLNTNGFFGASVGTAGDVNGDMYDDLIIGMTNFENNGGTADEGAAFVYYGGEDGPDTTYDWLAEGNSLWAHLGDNVGTAGDVNNDGYDDVVAGAYYFNMNYGAYFAWYGSATGLGPNGNPGNADWKIYSSQLGAGLNFVGTAGDVNGDNYDDVITGAPEYDQGQTNEGLVAVWYGSENGLGTETTIASADWTLEGEANERKIGASIGTLGDVNGDGYDDIVVGSYRTWGTNIDGGDLMVFYGSDTGLGDPAKPADADWRVADPVGDDKLTFSVQRHPADLDGDGYMDLIASVNGLNVISGTKTLTDTGAVMVWYGSPGGLGKETMDGAGWAAYGDQASGFLGFFLDAAGDVDGNGLDDILAAAPFYDIAAPGKNEGRVYAFYSRWSIYFPAVQRP